MLYFNLLICRRREEEAGSWESVHDYLPFESTVPIQYLNVDELVARKHNKL